MSRLRALRVAYRLWRTPHTWQSVIAVLIIGVAAWPFLVTLYRLRSSSRSGGSG
jgi:hypothetical protein